MFCMQGFVTAFKETTLTVFGAYDSIAIKDFSGKCFFCVINVLFLLEDYFSSEYVACFLVIQI